MQSRKEITDSLERGDFDVCIIGGGSAGAGCALDAQLRGLKTALVEGGDFASGSSSASTKMVHGGVRYLQAAVAHLDRVQYRVLRRALRERASMLRNAPFLTRKIEFLIPCFSLFEKYYYAIGMKLYDWISGGASLQPSRLLSRDEALLRAPAIRSRHLEGAVVYADGQFDDARYALALIQTFRSLGGQALNYALVTSFDRDAGGKLSSAIVEDCLTGRHFAIRARKFVNATGPAADSIRQLASPQLPGRIRLSKGVHVFLPRDDFHSFDALLVPKTEDGRVIFAIPWNGRLLVGTTDTEYTPGEEMILTKDEIDYLLRQLNPYLDRPFTTDQVVSGIAGIRPLLGSGKATETKNLSRDDEVEVDPASGLISILGGKWTTYRLMAEETINEVQRSLGVDITASLTRDYPLAGTEGYTTDYWLELKQKYNLAPSTAQHLAYKYGVAAENVMHLVRKSSDLGLPLVEGLAPLRAQVVYAAREEMAQTLEDVLARRIGLELYSWKLTIQAAPLVASLMAGELGWSASERQSALAEYTTKVNHYLQTAGLASGELPAHTV
jgi:glycerol-3-phosphate dehydrogenase